MIIRTLGFYQPFCTLMAHGKIETRWVRKGRKPPFPLGRYFFYSTKKVPEDQQLQNWCGDEIIYRIYLETAEDMTRLLNGYGLMFADLVEVRLMTKEDEEKAFVKFVGEQEIYSNYTDSHIYSQWALIFENVQTIEPILFKDGKQGVGILKQPYLNDIQGI